MCELTDKLRSYNPTSGYSRWMREAAAEIDRLRERVDEADALVADAYLNYDMAPNGARWDRKAAKYLAGT